MIIEVADSSAQICKHCRLPVTVTGSGDPVSPGDRHLDRAVHTATGLEPCADGRHIAAPIEADALVSGAGGAAAKPAPAGLGIGLEALEWERSGDGDGSVEVAFPEGGDFIRGDWVLMRKAGDPDGLVLVFDRNEWDCFLDGARNGEFDDIAEPSRS
jgi:hypothetical protein